MTRLREMIEAAKRKHQTTVISARIPNEVIRKLDRLSKRTGRSRNEIINLYLKFAVKNILENDARSCRQNHCETADK